MRHLLLATTLILSPVVALAAAGPTCSVRPSPQETAAILNSQGAGSSPTAASVPVPPAVDPQQQAARLAPQTPPHAAPGPTTVSTSPPAAPAPASAAQVAAVSEQTTTQMELPALSESEISLVPVLQHIASAGATLLDLGTEHGMRTVFAKSGNAFQVFYVAPDGQAVIGGIMWDQAGRDVTRDQVKSIPGVIPTVRLGPEAKASPAATEVPLASPLALVQETTYGTVGSSDAPHLWMFIDPFCAFSVRAMQQLQPYVKAGKVQLSVIPISVLDYEDHGFSTPAAKIMVSEPADQMVADWTSGSLKGTPSADALALLERNMQAASALHLKGTPTLIWRESDNAVGRADGVPPDFNAIIASIGH
jgi:thiol:disulfide interchange protein DsbG